MTAAVGATSVGGGDNLSRAGAAVEAVLVVAGLASALVLVLWALGGRRWSSRWHVHWCYQIVSCADNIGQCEREERKTKQSLQRK